MSSIERERESILSIIGNNSFIEKPGAKDQLFWREFLESQIDYLISGKEDISIVAIGTGKKGNLLINSTELTKTFFMDNQKREDYMRETIGILRDSERVGVHKFLDLAPKGNVFRRFLTKSEKRILAISV